MKLIKYIAPIFITLNLAPISPATPTLSTVATFEGSNGRGPYGGVVADAQGNLYGTTITGGTVNNGSGVGTVFKIDAVTHNLTDLYTFVPPTGNPNGSQPETPLLLSGNTLYGESGGGDSNGDGTIFSIPVTGGPATVLARFNGTNGNTLFGGLIMSGGMLYGMTYRGGPNISGGTVFSVPATGGPINVLTAFTNATGTNPMGGLLLSGGNLYGATELGGAYGQGTVFSLPVAGGTPSVLCNFNGSNGAQPLSSLTLIGNELYGVTQYGGVGFSKQYTGDGVVYSVPINGGTPTSLFTFNGTNGKYPSSNLIADANGTLYSTTDLGGSAGDGIIFSIPSSGGSMTTLANFSGANGSDPQICDLTNVGDTLYGTTLYGGDLSIPVGNNFGIGTVFQLTGSGFVVPEPTSSLMIAVSGLTLLRRRSRGPQL